ncbi:MAG: FUSC family protein [Neisseria sp.]|nr:FUSC family protein [Neisseria sp.]
MDKLLYVLRLEIKSLLTIQKSERPWELPLAAALSSGIPLFIGAFFGHIEYGLMSSLGGMVFLSLPNTALAHRMSVMMCAAAGMAACFFFGLIGAYHPYLAGVLLGMLTIVVTMLCRYFRIGPPGSMFFVMAAAIAAFMPIDVLQIPYRVGLVFMGSLWACVVALVYSWVMLVRGRPYQPLSEPLWDFDVVVVDAVIIGFFVMLSIFLAHALQFSRPYWVPVSCLAVIQGMTFRAVWHRQLHRIVGTMLGVVVAWGLLNLHLNVWLLCVLMTLLAFIIEMLVVRHYALAVMFITPLTIFLAEAGSLHAAGNEMVAARFYDTVLGCVIGVIGGLVIHRASLRRPIARFLRQIVPPEAA